MLLKRKVANMWQAATGRKVLGREEPGRALTIGYVLAPNPGGARAGSSTGSITSITPPRPASAVHEAEALLADWGFRQTREGWGAQGPEGAFLE